MRRGENPDSTARAAGAFWVASRKVEPRTSCSGASGANFSPPPFGDGAGNRSNLGGGTRRAGGAFEMEWVRSPRLHRRRPALHPRGSVRVGTGAKMDLAHGVLRSRA